MAAQATTYQMFAQNICDRLPLPAGHEIFVRIVTPAGALSAGVPDSDPKTLRVLCAFAVPSFFPNRPRCSRRQGRKGNIQDWVYGCASYNLSNVRPKYMRSTPIARRACDLYTNRIASRRFIGWCTRFGSKNPFALFAPSRFNLFFHNRPRCSRRQGRKGNIQDWVYGCASHKTNCPQGMRALFES